MSHTQFGLGYGTAVQIAAYNAGAGIPYELVYDLTNSRVVIMLGTGAGNFVALATEPYVQAQIAALTAGNTVNFVNWLYNS
jgi:hypothetical protein